MTKQEKVIECCRMLWKVLEYGGTQKETIEHIGIRRVQKMMMECIGTKENTGEDKAL